MATCLMRLLLLATTLSAFFNGTKALNDTLKGRQESHGCVVVVNMEDCTDTPAPLIEWASNIGSEVKNCEQFIDLLSGFPGEGSCLSDLSSYAAGSGKVYEVCPSTCNACCLNQTHGISGLGGYRYHGLLVGVLPQAVGIQRALGVAGSTHNFSDLHSLYGSYGSNTDGIHPTDPATSPSPSPSPGSDGPVDESQRSSLSRPKPSIEIVLARYGEDTSWALAPSKRHDARIHIYNKGTEPIADDVRNAASVVALPNVGRESHTYLHHIVSNYDNLADWTVFSQADAPSFGYKGHREGGGHLVAGVTFDDYLTPRNDSAYFVYNQIVQLPSMHHSSRYSYFYETLLEDKGDVCPPSEHGWTPWWDLGWFVDFIADKVKNQEGMDALDFYRKYIDASKTERRSLEISYAQGARFALSRTVIQSQEKHVYERLLAELALNEDPWSGYYMEWMWADLFLGAGRAPCNAPTHGTAVSHPEMMEAVLRHFDLQTSSRSLSSGTSGISSGSISGGSTGISGGSIGRAYKYIVSDAQSQFLVPLQAIWAVAMLTAAMLFEGPTCA